MTAQLRQRWIKSGRPLYLMVDSYADIRSFTNLSARSILDIFRFFHRLLLLSLSLLLRLSSLFRLSFFPFLLCILCFFRILLAINGFLLYMFFVFSLSFLKVTSLFKTLLHYIPFFCIFPLFLSFFVRVFSC